MEFKDLLLTPVYLIIIYGLAYWLRPKLTNKFTRKYFIPALTVKLIGAIGLGLIYQFYYGGGDTFNYFHHIKIMFAAFQESPYLWLKLMLSSGQFDNEIYKYSVRMEWYRSPTEFIVIKFGSFFSLLCFNTYTVIGLFFAFLSFTGMWQMYRTFLKLYPTLYKEFAIAVFFLPSVFFWGSGLMKDSLTIGFLGWLFYGFYQGLIEKRNIFKSAVIILVAAYLIYSIKVYILLSFLPPALFWIFLENQRKIKNPGIRMLAKPFFIIAGLAMAYLGATRLTEGDARYDIDKIGERSKINAIYLTKQVATGSAYDIGIFDGSLSSMLTVGPQAIVVSLYRPFIWEVRNPVMLLSAIEASIFIFLTLRFFYRTGFIKTLKFIGSKPILIFCFVFSLVLAFGVGTNSGNFGTLVRYKIPLMPFYMAGLYIMQAHAKRPKKLSRLAVTA
ncbi:hypothetical protein AAE02nite_08700 [Adhaeribacter aerolatus]|uniref:Glycosyltransferase RgtA/B/C/D-like domain-containing protein n=1 Tax=Adhaeribacter aerolatus TaxID=670289 RepID=A0A512AU14_9BACT|nr:hypothetical protein [Adhaeribacter aerolatus]GEO03206.1 hypothetical protein AAE02nite_08700 [Adhaeribacter aerolatus]